MDKNRIDGAGKQAAGWVKETAGKATGERGLQARGAAQKNTGKAQRGLGRFADMVRSIFRR